MSCHFFSGSRRIFFVVEKFHTPIESAPWEREVLDLPAIATLNVPNLWNSTATGATGGWWLKLKFFPVNSTKKLRGEVGFYPHHLQGFIYRGERHNHVRNFPKKLEKPETITKGLATCQSLGLIFSCNGWCLWWTPYIQTVVGNGISEPSTVVLGVVWHIWCKISFIKSGSCHGQNAAGYTYSFAYIDNIPAGGFPYPSENIWVRNGNPPQIWVKRPNHGNHLGNIRQWVVYFKTPKQICKRLFWVCHPTPKYRHIIIIRTSDWWEWYIYVYIYMPTWMMDFNGIHVSVTMYNHPMYPMGLYIVWSFLNSWNKALVTFRYAKLVDRDLYNGWSWSL